MNLRDRYLGTSLGSVWAITNPLFMLALFTYVFGFVFKVRLPGAETTLAFVIWLISGYGPWIALNESIMIATTAVVGASGLVKNMAFKTELLPIAGALVGVISLMVSFCFLFILLIWNGNDVTWHLMLLPFLILVQLAFAISVGIWFSVFAVFIRDVVHMLPTLLTAIMFMTPIFYSFDSMPVLIQKASAINPIYHLVEGYRSVILLNKIPNMVGLIYVLFLSIVIFFLGLSAFRRAKGSFDSAL